MNWALYVSVSFIYIYMYIKDTDSNKRDNNNNDIKSGNWQLFFEIEVNIPKATIHRDWKE